MQKTLIKTAEALRKLAKEKEQEKMQKCAKILLGLSALNMLKAKLQ